MTLTVVMVRIRAVPFLHLVQEVPQFLLIQVQFLHQVVLVDDGQGGVVQGTAWGGATNEQSHEQGQMMFHE